MFIFVVMNKVAILLGNNIDDGRDYLQEARAAINTQIGTIVSVSSVYSSPPWGYLSNNSYKNQVVICTSEYPPLTILSRILTIETNLGRIRNHSSATYQDRTIDIDILLYNSDIVQHEQLEIPHPRMHLRKFCLLPLAQLEANWIVPTSNKSVQELLIQCEDTSEVIEMDKLA
jgi:2-amino-4-hydroxy-6-hydroxymethyldihydropteridine diphosphokinase